TDLVQAGKCHHPPIPQSHHRRIPAPVCHALRVAERVCRRIEDRYLWLSMERIVLDRAAIDEYASILQQHHAITEHVPGYGKLIDSLTASWVQEQCPGAIRWAIGRS